MMSMCDMHKNEIRVGDHVVFGGPPLNVFRVYQLRGGGYILTKNSRGIYTTILASDCVALIDLRTRPPAKQRWWKRWFWNGTEMK